MLVEAKKHLVPDKQECDVLDDKINKKYILPDIMNRIYYYFETSFRNPFNAQGKLVLGMDNRFVGTISVNK